MTYIFTSIALLSVYTSATLLHISTSGNPLHDAIMKGADKETLLYLAEYANATNDRNESALTLAVNLDNYEACELLLKRGLDVNFIDGSGAPAIQHAICDNNLRMVNFLLAHGAGATCMNRRGRTALMTAAKYGHVGIGKALLMNNPREDAKVNLKDAKGWNVMHHAAYGGHYEFLNLMSYTKVNPLSRDAKNRTPLDLAIMKGRTRAACSLICMLEYYFNSNGMAEELSLAIGLAVRFGRKHILLTLLKNGRHLESRDEQGNTVLMSAAANEIEYLPLPLNVEIVKTLILSGANLEATNKAGENAAYVAKHERTYSVISKAMKVASSRDTSKDILPQLHWEITAETSDLERIRTLLNSGQIDINETDYLDRTAAHLAAEFNHVQLMRELVFKGCDLTLKNCLGHTVLHLVKSVEMAKFLLEANPTLADIADELKNLPLHRAVFDQQEDLVEILAPNTVNIHAMNIMDVTALGAASELGNYEITKCILKHGARKDMGSYDSNAPYVAVVNCHSNIVNLFVEHGWNVTTPNKYGQTAAHIAVLACERRNIDLIRFLIKDLNPDSVNVSKYSLLTWAADFSFGADLNAEVLDIIIEHGVPLDLRTFRGKTALHIFAKYNHHEAIRMLIDKGANLASKTPRGCTALHVACKYLRPQSAAILMHANREILTWKNFEEGGYHTPVLECLYSYTLHDAISAKAKIVMAALELTPEDVPREDWKRARQHLSIFFETFIEDLVEPITFEEYIKQGITDYKNDNKLEENVDVDEFVFKGLGVFYAFVTAYYPELASKEVPMTETEEFHSKQEEYRNAIISFEKKKNKFVYFNKLRFMLVESFMSEEGRKRIIGTYMNYVPLELMDDTLVCATNSNNVWGRMELLANSLMLTFPKREDLDLHPHHDRLLNQMARLSETILLK